MAAPRLSVIMPRGAAGSEAAGVSADAPASVVQVPQEVVDFIRYCYQRRRIGWPELYDEMCGVAARAEFRGMDYDRLAALGVRFSLCDMARLAAMAQRVVLDERRRRVAIPVGPSLVPGEGAPDADVPVAAPRFVGLPQ